MGLVILQTLKRSIDSATFLVSSKSRFLHQFNLRCFTYIEDVTK